MYSKILFLYASNSQFLTSQFSPYKCTWKCVLCVVYFPLGSNQKGVAVVKVMITRSQSVIQLGKNDPKQCFAPKKLWNLCNFSCWIEYDFMCFLVSDVLVIYTDIFIKWNLWIYFKMKIVSSSIAIHFLEK